MTKKITIEQKDGKIAVFTEGFSQMELIGIFRFQEKKIFCSIMEKNDPENSKITEGEEAKKAAEEYFKTLFQKSKQVMKKVKVSVATPKKVVKKAVKKTTKKK